MKKLLLLFVSLLSLSSTAALANYYEQFMFVEGECTQANKPGFRSVLSHNYLIYGRNEGGNQLGAGLLLQIYTDGTYIAEYKEVTYAPNDKDILGVHFMQEIAGKWNINQNNELVLEGLGKASPIKTIVFGEMRNALSIQFEAAFHDERVMGKNISLGYIFNFIGPRGLSMNEYCSKE